MKNPYTKNHRLSYDILLRFPVARTLRQKESEVIMPMLSKMIKPGDRVLEIGSGSGYYTEKIFGITKNILAIEESPQMIQSFQKRFLKRGLIAPPVLQGRFPDVVPEELFDHVVAIGVLDFVSAPDAFLQRLLSLSRASSLFTVVEQYPFGKVGHMIALLSGSQTFLCSQVELRRILSSMRFEIHSARVKFFGLFPATTLICLVEKRK